MIRPDSDDHVRRILAKVLVNDQVPCHAGLHMVPVPEVAVIDHSGAICTTCAAKVDAEELVTLADEPCNDFQSAGKGLMGDWERTFFCINCGWEKGDHRNREDDDVRP